MTARLARGILALALTATAAALPYRFLVVVNDQWKDPASMVIEGGDEFNIVAALLKTWAIPFDILRLDQQRLDRYHTLERDGTPRYSTVIWLGGPQAAGERGALIGWLVREAGVSLIVPGEHASSPDIAALAGIAIESENRLPDPLKIEREHFLTREIKGRERELASGGSAFGYKAAAKGATVLASRGSSPFVAIREYEGGGKAVWFGAHRRTAQLSRQFLRDLFKRCLVWTQGFALYAEYSRSILIEMHDQGNSEKTVHTFWHFLTLGEEQQRRYVIEPLERAGGRVTQVVNTGLVDRATRTVVEPWKQNRYPDQIDPSVVHDYASTKRGLDLGVRRGVYEINSHGWTHFLPDLDSAPGPYWNAAPDGVASLEWYTEFVDRLRGKDVPAATQRFHMRRSIEYLERDFGVTPLFLRPPAGGPSLSYPNHTPRIAAEMGFGLTRVSSPYYLGRDLVVQLGPVITGATWATPDARGAGDVPWTRDGPFFLAFHDRDVALDPPWFGKVLSNLGPGVRYITANEYTGYLHARVERNAAGRTPWSLKLRYDDHYGRYFRNAESRWTLHLSDAVRGDAPEKREVRLPAGLGPHEIP